jgi:serine/threonine protein kinase
MKKVKKESFDEGFIIDILSQLIYALSYCERQNIIHINLKSENTLLSNENRLKLIDFGFSKQMETISKTMNTQPGIYIYLSLEMIYGKIFF